MSALVERIIAARDRLRGFAVPSDDDIIEARDVMADAANAITERDELIMRLSAEAETLRSDLLDAKDDVDRLSAQLDPCARCGGSRVELFVSYGNSVDERPCSFCYGTDVIAGHEDPPRITPRGLLSGAGKAQRGGLLSSLKIIRNV